MLEGKAAGHRRQKEEGKEEVETWEKRTVRAPAGSEELKQTRKTNKNTTGLCLSCVAVFMDKSFSSTFPPMINWPICGDDGQRAHLLIRTLVVGFFNTFLKSYLMNQHFGSLKCPYTMFL